MKKVFLGREIEFSARKNKFQRVKIDFAVQKYNF